MLRNYVNIAWRNLVKNKLNTFINVTGLSIGMTCCALILLYVADELNYDRFWPQGDRIYRMALERKYPDRSTKYAIIPPSYWQSVRKETPQVEETVRVFVLNGGNTPTLLKLNNQVLEERHFLLADSTFFRVFQVPFVRGLANQVLNRPNTVVLTAKTAKRLFGNANPIGKQLKIVQGPTVEITGICADLPANSHFTFDFIASTAGFPLATQTNHVSFAAHTYLLLKPNVLPGDVQAKFPAVIEKYAAGEIQRNFGVAFRDYVKAGNGYVYFLQPLRQIHLDSHLEAEHQPNGSRTLVYLFTIIAAFILLIACVNFMNLSTARSAERAREVGIRKSLGSTRGQLAIQFLTESVVVSLGSFLVAVGLLIFLLPYFNQLADKQLSLISQLHWYTLPVLLALVILVGLLAGSYPAGVLSAFEPIKVLKGKFFNTRQGYWLRNSLVVVQFSISVILIISAIVVFRQLQYLQDKELGFAKESVLKLRGAGFLDKNTEAFKQDVARLAGVERVSGTSAAPGEPGFFGVTFRKNGSQETVTGRGAAIDDEYVQTMRMNMAAGRPFDRPFNDSLSVILNEEAIRELGLVNPIGKQISSPDNYVTPGGPPVFYTVVGVVKNFHFSSLHERISPLFLINDRFFNRTNNQIVIRLRSSDDARITTAQIDRIWKRYLPDQPFHYSFLTSDWNTLYQSEQVSQRVVGIFSLLAIFLACMGLLGLAVYIIQQRTKEIGIRKVLGASIPSLITLLSKNFLKLVLIAIVIASPIAWYAMNRWLQDFAYRIDIEWWVFAVAGLLAMGIALVTVSFQSLKTALMNPVTSLRSE